MPHGLTIDMNYLMELVQDGEDESEEVREELLCMSALRPIFLSSEMDLVVCVGFLNDVVDPRGVVRHALTALWEMRRRFDFFGWYVDLTRAHPIDAVHRVFPVLLRDFMVPYMMLRLTKGNTTLDAVAPLLFFVPFLSLPHEQTQEYVRLIKRHFFSVRAPLTLTLLNTLVCQQQEGSVVGAYIDYVMREGSQHVLCASMMIENGMCADVCGGVILTRLIDRWLVARGEGVRLLLTHAIGSSTYVALKTYDYLVHGTRTERHDSHAAGVLVDATLRAVPYLDVAWSAFDTSSDVWETLRARRSRQRADAPGAFANPWNVAPRPLA